MPSPLRLERDRAYHGLVDLILGAKLGRDKALSERKLAQALEIGRTPVREAHRDLVRDGVLEVRPARGTFVRHLDANDVREMYEVRHGLEGVAAKLAARNGPTAELSAYGPSFRDMIDRPGAYGPEQVYETGARFHTAIVHAAANAQLVEIYEPLRLRFRLALSLPRYYDHARVWASVNEHLAILEAIEARDERRAHALICDHLALGSEARTRIFADLTGVSTASRPPAEPRERR